MPGLTAADTIRILVATDSHVGYNERDPIRGDDSWKSFHEVMCLAKEQDVDMVLLAGDLFHDNKPSRKSMYQVMRSLRMNCYGEKPCELEMLSDASETFQGAFNHVNYEDPDINVAIPVFSIHGNHDDPSGEGHLAALDLLQMSGLLNYYGRTPESDNILVKPVLLQKGHTKLALYGMSNVRDERLFRTFRDGKVKFFQPGMQKNDWFNLMSVHQNHHAYTETGYLPENFLPEFLDLVIWGHEHECLIDPRYNPEMNFHVMQPGSSVATSLVPGESVPKHVAILSITGREFKSEPTRLKTVRPFIMKEIVLHEDKEAKHLAKKENNRTQLTQYLTRVVDALIEEAKTEWLETQESTDPDEPLEPPLPLIRLRVEYSAPNGGAFDCENPQRFSNRFVGKVANVNDVVQFHRRKTTVSRKSAKDGSAADLPEDSVLAQLALDNVKVEKLVREFLTAQSLTILPQNSFGDAVAQFVDKDDKHAMEMFVNESLANQIKHLMDVDDDADEDELTSAMDRYKSRLEELFAAGHLKKAKKGKLKPRPENWDSDLDGDWGDQPGAVLHSDHGDEDDEDDGASLRSATPASRGGRVRAKAATATSTRKKPATAASKATTAKKSAPTRGGGARSRKKVVEEEEEDSDEENIPDHHNDNGEDEEEDDENIVMLDDSDNSNSLFVKPAPAPSKSTRAPAKKPTPSSSTTSTRKTPARTTAATARQSKLDFSQPAASQGSAAGARGKAKANANAGAKANGRGGGKKTQGPKKEISGDEISEEDEDAFEPASSARSTRARR